MDQWGCEEKAEAELSHRTGKRLWKPATEAVVGGWGGWYGGHFPFSQKQEKPHGKVHGGACATGLAPVTNQPTCFLPSVQMTCSSADRLPQFTDFLLQFHTNPIANPAVARALARTDSRDRAVWFRGNYINLEIWARSGFLWWHNTRLWFSLRKSASECFSIRNAVSTPFAVTLRCNRGVVFF